MSATALWIYDYLLTFKDEVTDLSVTVTLNGILTTSYRSVMHGKRRACSVCEPSDFSWSAPTNGVSVFVLFLFVGAFYYQHHASLTVV